MLKSSFWDNSSCDWFPLWKGVEKFELTLKFSPVVLDVGALIGLTFSRFGWRGFGYCIIEGFNRCIDSYLGKVDLTFHGLNLREN